MENLVTIGVRAARRAGDIIIRGMSRLDQIEIESKQRNDFVTDIDRAAEADIIETIHRSFPDHAILGEESGRIGSNEVCWIVDPLDGTTNFIHGFPYFAVSIGVRVGKQMEAAIVYDPASQELFTASRGRGAHLNDRRIRVSKRRGLEGALIGTGFPFKRNQNIDEYLEILRPIIQKTAGIRRPGAAALDLAWLAAGRTDGFWETGLKPWDVAAGSLLIREAGGVVTDHQGKEDWLESGNILAGNLRVHTALLAEIMKVRGK